MRPNKTFVSIIIALSAVFCWIPNQAATSQTDEMYHPVQLSLGTVTSASWQPHGESIAIGGSQGVRLYTSEFQFLKQLTSEATELVVWNPAGTKLASLSRDKVTLWDIDSGNAEFVSRGVSCPITFSPDGNSLALGTDNGAIRIVNALDGSFVVLYQGQQVQSSDFDANWTRPEAIMWSNSESELIAFGGNPPSGKSIDRWNFQTGVLLQQINLEGFLHDVSCAKRIAWNPNGRQVFNLTNNGAAAIWDIQTGDVIATSHHAVGLPDTFGIAWSPDGTKLVSYETVGDDLVLWDTSNLNVLNTFHLAQPSPDPDFHSSSKELIFSLSWSPDSSRFLISSIGGATIIDVETGQMVQRLQGYTGEANTLDWSPDGKYLATGHGRAYGFSDNRIRIWDTENEVIVQTCLVHTGRINDVSWSPSGTQIASAAGDFNNADGTLRIWNPATCEQLGAIWSGTIIADRVDWKTDGTQISLGRDTIYNADLKVLQEIPTYGISQWSPDGHLLAITQGNSANLVIYQANDFTESTTVTNYSDEIYKLEWSPDGTQIATISRSKNIIAITDIFTQEHILLEGHHAPVQAISWNTQNNLLASAASDNTIRIWDMATGAEIAVFENQVGITDLAWSPDGTMLASCSETGDIIIWK